MFFLEGMRSHGSIKTDTWCQVMIGASDDKNMIEKEFLEKTELCEVAPNPSEGTMAILRALYADGGPVWRAYRRCGITYHDTDFLRVVGGELFVERERELQSLFPSHSYFFDETRIPRPVRLKGFWTSLKNTRRFHSPSLFVGTQSYGGTGADEITKEIHDRLMRDRMSGSRQQIVDQFLEDYEWIFLGNLFAERAVARLTAMLPEGMTIADALAFVPEDFPEIWDAPTDVVGNTFEVSDTSKFASFVGTVSSKKVPNEIPTKELFDAQMGLRLREYGRWLAMRGLTGVRKGQSVVTPWAIASLEQNGQRKLVPVGVSAGEAEGILADHSEEGGIWVLKTLSPELVNHLKGVKGVIAKNGGLLSHFAIIAREMRIPVVVKYPIEMLMMGKRVRMNGGTGEVVVLGK